ncbi:MAG: pantetheine-phosphate adenylyltransferase [Beijerinckiaceae bacterium]
MKRIGLYPGSFDPLTNGHLDMLKAAFGMFDHVVVAIGVHPSKAPLFSPEERLEMIMEAGKPLAIRADVTFEVRMFDTLVTHFAKEVGATALIRGLRDGTDLDYEMQLSGMNGALAPSLQTVFFPASPLDRHITATLVRQVAAMGGDVTPFVPKSVARLLAKKFKKTR